MNRVLKYKARKVDPRDYTFSVERDPTKNVETFTTIKKSNTLQGIKYVSAPSFSISPLPAIINQGQLGACTANAFYYTTMKQTKNMLPLSRLYLYANCRCIDDTPLNQDDGTTIASLCKAVATYGLCKEVIYSYDIKKFVDLPPLIAYQSAKKLKVFNYTYIKQDLNSLKGALTLYNVPIIFGICVYDSFLTNDVATNGIVPMPNTEKEICQGGHCIVAVGYDDATKTFTCANSWGTSWGNKGYFYLPYDYITFNF